MTITKEEIITAIDKARGDARQLAAGASESAWTSGVYENGWNAKQLLCHLALTANVPGYLIGIAQVARSSSGGGAPSLNVDEFNEREVARRRDNPVSEILDEIDATYETSIAAVKAAPDDLLAGTMRTPWGTEGVLAEMILHEDLRDHVMVHLSEMASALGSTAA